MEHLKILVVLPFFYPHKGGSQKYAEDIYYTMMIKHSEVKVDILTYNTDRVKEYESYRGFRIFRIPCINILPGRFTLPNPMALIKILKELAKNKYDIVNTHIRFFDPTWWVWAYAKGIGAKSYFTGHVATHPIYQNKFVEMIAKTVDLTIAKGALKQYDLITYISETTKKFFEKTLGTKSKRGKVIYMNINTKEFLKRGVTNKIPKIEKEIAPNTTVITYVGRVIWTKGITYLYEAIIGLQKEITSKKVLFVIGGPGELVEQLRAQIKKDALEDKVLVLGNLEYEEVKKLLSVTDIYINPSHHSEGLPIAIMEAGAAGCFVIATDNAGTKEIIVNHKTGLLIKQRNVQEIKDSILWALNHKTECGDMAKTLQQIIAEKFDYETNAETLYVRLKDLIK